MQIPLAVVMDEWVQPDDGVFRDLARVLVRDAVQIMVRNGEFIISAQQAADAMRNLAALTDAQVTITGVFDKGS